MGHVYVAELPAASSDRAMVSGRVSPDLVEYAGPAVIAAFRRPYSRPIVGAALTDADPDPDDDLKVARGFANGVLLAVPMWGLIGLLTWFVLSL
jgi:hypothetical protein